MQQVFNDDRHPKMALRASMLPSVRNMPISSLMLNISLLVAKCDYHSPQNTSAQRSVDFLQWGECEYLNQTKWETKKERFTLPVLLTACCHDDGSLEHATLWNV